MGLVSSSIPNLLNGVSQQPSPLRQTTQAEIQLNGLSDVADGLKKRPHTENTGSFPTSGTMEGIDLDTTLIYPFEFSNQSKCLIAYNPPTPTASPSGTPIPSTTVIRIIDLGKGVTASDAGDYNFPNSSDNYIRKGVSGNNEKTLTAEWHGYNLNNWNHANHYLHTQNPKRDLQVLVTESKIYILNRSYHPFIDTSSNTTGTLDSQLYNSFSELPDGVNGSAVTNRIYKIIGSPTSAFDTFYVKALSASTYEEAARPGQHKEFKAFLSVLEPNSPRANYWTCLPFYPAERTCGDTDSAVFPSFIDQRIESIFFFKNRLGVLCGENIIFSEAGNFTNFFPKTVTTLLDDAPIDVSLSYSRGSALKHAVVFNDSLTIFSDKKQFKIETNGPLTQKTISVVPSTDFDSNTAIPPVGAQNVMYFANTKGGFTSIKEYFIEADTVRSDALELTAHVPHYIPKDVNQVVTSESNDLVLTLTESGRVFVYKYFTDGEKKLQSSWSEWTFPSLGKIRAMHASGDYIHFVHTLDDSSSSLVRYGTSVIPLSMPLDSFQVKNDAGADENVCLLLDSKLEVTGASYSSSNDSTYIDIPSGYRAVPTVNNIVLMNKTTGKLLEIVDKDYTSISGSSYVTRVHVKGNLNNVPILMGFKYDFQYRLSTQYIRQNNGSLAVQSGRLQLKTMRVGFEDTGYFTVEVTPSNRDTSFYEFTGLVVNQIGSTVGNATLSDGTFRFPVMARNENVTIDIKSDSFLPCAFQTIDWEGFYTTRSRRI